MKKALCLVLLLAICTPLLSGCYSIAELDERIFAYVVTLDSADNGQLRIGVQAASMAQNESNPAGGSPGGGSDSGGAQDHSPNEPSHLQQGGYYLVSAVGQNYWQALTLLQAILPRMLDLSQVRQVIFSEELARSDALIDLIDALMMTSTMRQEAYMVVASGSALDFAAHQQSYLGSRLSEYIDMRVRNFSRFGFVAESALSHVWQDMHGNRIDTLVSYAAVNDGTAMHELTKDRALDDLPGHLPRASINKSEYLGAAMIGRKSMLGTITGFGMELTYLLSRGSRTLFYLNGDTPARLKQKRSPKLSVSRQGDQYTLSVEIWVAAWQSLPNNRVSNEEMSANLREACTSQLRFFQAQRFDPVGFGRMASKYFPTIDAWEAFDWREAFAQADLKVIVHVEDSDPI